MKRSTRTVLIGALATLTIASVGSAAAAPFDRSRVDASAVKLERDFATVGYGQLHFRRAEPIEFAGQVSANPVLCLHQTPSSSQVFVEFMGELAQDRIVFAVDTPGLGESDLPTEPPDIEDYAQAIGEFLDTQGLARIDVVGYHTGASIALELAAREPERIGSMMLVGLALFVVAERAGFFEQPWPRPTAADGSHLLEEWRRSARWQGPGQSDASRERMFLAKLAAGRTAWWGARAVMRHDLATRLRDNEHPLLVVNANDDLFRVTPRARALRNDADFVEFPEYGFGIFEVIPAELAALARKHFDAEER